SKETPILARIAGRGPGAQVISGVGLTVRARTAHQGERRIPFFSTGCPGGLMSADLSVVFTGVRFQNPFLLSSAPPTESESNILRAFEAGWGGVVTKTIGLHPVVNVRGPKTKFLRADVDSPRLSMKKRPNSALHSSWNWELISDRPLDWWVPRIGRIKKAFPDKVLVASIMAGSGHHTETRPRQRPATAHRD